MLIRNQQKPSFWVRVRPTHRRLRRVGWVGRIIEFDFYRSTPNGIPLLAMGEEGDSNILWVELLTVDSIVTENSQGQ